MNLVERIIKLEDGELSADDVVRLFAELIRTGSAWTLQGAYGRSAVALIEHGFLTKDGKIAKLPSEVGIT